MTKLLTCLVVAFAYLPAWGQQADTLKREQQTESLELKQKQSEAEQDPKLSAEERAKLEALHARQREEQDALQARQILRRQQSQSIQSAQPVAPLPGQRELQSQQLNRERQQQELLFDLQRDQQRLTQPRR